MLALTKLPKPSSVRADEARRGLATGALAGAACTALWLALFQITVEHPSVVLAYGAAFGAGSSSTLAFARELARGRTPRRQALLALASGPLSLVGGLVAFTAIVRLLTGHGPWETGWSPFWLRYGTLGVIQRGVVLALGLSAAELALGSPVPNASGVERARRGIATGTLTAFALVGTVFTGLVTATGWFASLGVILVVALSHLVVSALVKTANPRRDEIAIDADPRRWLALTIALLGTAAGYYPFQHSHKAANEAAVIHALRKIVTAESVYRERGHGKDGDVVYGTLADLARDGLIDDELASGIVSGYRIEVAPSKKIPEFWWQAVANPILPMQSGDRSFVTSQAGVGYYRLATVPIELDPEVDLGRLEDPRQDHKLIAG